MIDPLEAFAKYNIPIRGLLHVGANTASEAHQYARAGQFPVLFFEPIPRLAEVARENTAKYPNMKVCEACCSDRNNQQVVFHIASNNGQSSSILELGRHHELYPSIDYVDKITLKTIRMDTFLGRVRDADRFNCAVIDTQGADLKVLKGFGSSIDGFDSLYVEVADRALYKKGATVRDVQTFLDKRGFALVHLETTAELTYGNALFVRRTPTYNGIIRSALSVGKPARQSSVYKGMASYAANKANDGTLDYQKFFHTEIEWNPWWEVDLLEPRKMSGVYLFDRIGYARRSSRLIIDISRDKEVYKSIFVRSNVKGKLGQNYFVRADEVARYVRVRVPGRGYLHLCQVAVI